MPKTRLTTCSINNEDCTPNSQIVRGWCKLHYRRWERHGDPLHTEMPGWPGNFFPKLERQSNGCLYFTGRINEQGYGCLMIHDTHWYAHRASYELFVGPIPSGMVIDHLCHNHDRACAGGPSCLHRRCVEPSHLEVTTHATNLKRGRKPPEPPNATRNRDKTHCPRGHPYAGENLYRPPGTNHRMCVLCMRASKARQKASR